MRRIRTLKSQLTQMFVFISLLIMVVSSVLVYNQVLEILKSRSEKSTIQLFRHVEYSVSAFRNEAAQVALNLYMEPSVKNVLEQKGSKVDHLFLTLELRSRFKEMMSKYTYIDSLYLFTEDGEVVGVTESRSYSKSTSKLHPFYNTRIYHAGANPYSQASWFGGGRRADFSESTETTEKALAPDLLTITRYIKVLNNESRSGILVMNIKESALASVYQSLSDSDGMRTYIADDDGKIISALNKNDLGQRIPVFERERDRYGSFSLKDGNPRQIVYYRLQDSNWVLIKEIPMALFNQDAMKLQRILILVFVISLLLIILLTHFWTIVKLRPLKELAEKMNILERGRLGALISRFPANEIGQLGRQFNRMSRSIAELIEKNERTERKKRESEVKVLQAQINPHFLHNTLNSIKWMAIVGNARNIADSITSLGIMLQLLYKDTSLFHSVRDELEYVVHYVKMMNMRYGEGIRLQIDIPDPLREFGMLKLILQPVVENAFVHGYEQTHFKGLIYISARLEGEHLLVKVEDDGCGIPANRLEQIRGTMTNIDDDHEDNAGTDSIGLVNTHHRIRLHYGSGYGVELESVYGAGTVVWLRLPRIVLNSPGNADPTIEGCGTG